MQTAPPENKKKKDLLKPNFKNMKKLIIIALVFSAVAMISQSCNKDEKLNDQKSKELFASSEMDETEAKIIKFIDRMDLVRENPNYPGSENWNYSEDSTVWYIEAALNYKNAHASWFYEFKIEDSTEAGINSNAAGTFNIVNIQIFYDDVISELNSQFASINSEHKALLFVDVINSGYSNNTLSLKSYIFWGKGQVELPDGEWYIEGNSGMANPQSYNMQNAMAKIVQETGISVLGAKDERADVYYTSLNWDKNTIPSEPYNGFHYTGFLPGYWLYAEEAQYQTTSPHYQFTETLYDYQIDFYTSNLEQLGDIRGNKVNKVDFDWKVYLKYGAQSHTSPWTRWMTADFHLGVQHLRLSTPNVFIQ